MTSLIAFPFKVAFFGLAIILMLPLRWWLS
jgi:hypothetical protein